MKLCLLIFPLLLATALGNEDCEFTCSLNKLLLFAIRAGTGYSAVGEFDNKKRTDTLKVPEKIPDVFRSAHLDHLPGVINEMSFNRIVVEMRTANKPVAWAKFDVSSDPESLDSHNWFVVKRLVESHPYWVGKDENNFVDFSIKGSRDYQRSFYIHHNRGGCDVESGLMGVVDFAFGDECSWAWNGKAPVLFYAARMGKYDNSGEPGTVRFADQLLIYLDKELMKIPK